MHSTWKRTTSISFSMQSSAKQPRTWKQKNDDDNNINKCQKIYCLQNSNDFSRSLMHSWFSLRWISAFIEKLRRYMYVHGLWHGCLLKLKWVCMSDCLFVCLFCFCVYRLFAVCPFFVHENFLLTLINVVGDKVTHTAQGKTCGQQHRNRGNKSNIAKCQKIMKIASTYTKYKWTQFMSLNWQWTKTVRDPVRVRAKKHKEKARTKWKRLKRRGKKSKHRSTIRVRPLV